MPDPPPSVARVGSRGLLLRVPAGLVQPTRAVLEREPLAGQRDVVVGAESVLVRFDRASQVLAGREALAQLRAEASDVADQRTVDIDVVYDGEDLDQVAELTGLGTGAVIGAHTGQRWHVAFVGFAPGFAYLHGQDERLHVPRRDSPRTSIPAGSVALAGAFSAVYPRASPGGWRLIGHTDATLWSTQADPPSPLAAGVGVQFHAVRESVAVTEPSRVTLAVPAPGGRALIVRAPGAQCLVQDAGRPGLGVWGVSGSGAADQSSFRAANRLVGNEANTAVLEHAGGGLRLESVGENVLAVTGAAAAVSIEAEHQQRRVALGRPFALRDGELLLVAAPSAGLRSYLAVRGGVDAPQVMGSRSTDTLAGLGVEPLVAGATLPVLDASGSAVADHEVLPPQPQPDAVCALDVVLGPDSEWFDDLAVGAWSEQEWTVTPDSNRVGMRLAGEPVSRREGELPSQGLVRGAIQIPPSGQPVLMLADHPATGGYPVIAVVADHHLDLAAQVPIGARIRFVVSAD